MKKITLIVATLFVAMCANAQTLATFETGVSEPLSVDAGGWHIETLFSKQPSVYNNPDKTGINASDKCAGATNVADADWWGNFMSLKLADKVTITDQNRFLTFMAYRSIQPKKFRVAFNNNDDGNDLWTGRLDNDATWQKVTIDLGEKHMGKDLETILFILSCNWDDPRTGWGEASYFFDNFQLSSADAILDEDVAYTNPASPTSASIVELKRSFTAGWNTLCLPISLSQEQIAKIFGEGSKVAHFAGFDGANINFSTANQALNANEPVLIQPTKTDVSCFFVNDVTVSPVTLPSNTMKKTVNGETLSFIGNYAPIDDLNTMGSATESVYYVEGSNVYKLDAGSSIAQKGFRAYFKSTGATADKTAILVDGETTAIQNVETAGNVKANGQVYDLSGRQVAKNGSVESLPKGIYIVNGKKVLK